MKLLEENVQSHFTIRKFLLIMVWLKQQPPLEYSYIIVICISRIRQIWKLKVTVLKSSSFTLQLGLIMECPNVLKQYYLSMRTFVYITYRSLTLLCWYIAGINSNQCIFQLMITTYIHISYCCHSAGIGQTGTFIAIDIELQRIKQEGVVDVYNTVCKLRHSRMSTIQTLVIHQNEWCG